MIEYRRQFHIYHEGLFRERDGSFLCVTFCDTSAVYPAGLSELNSRDDLKAYDLFFWGVSDSA